MGQWVEIGNGRRYEIVPLGRLSVLQTARACREVGLTPEQLERALAPGAVDRVDQVDRFLALSVLIWAARLAAGERHPTVASADDYRMEDLVFGDDDEEETADPTGPGSVGDALPDPPESSTGSSTSRTTSSTG